METFEIHEIPHLRISNGGAKELSVILQDWMDYKEYIDIVIFKTSGKRKRMILSRALQKRVLSDAIFRKEYKETLGLSKHIISNMIADKYFGHTFRDRVVLPRTEDKI